MASEKGRRFSQLKWKDRLRIEQLVREKKSRTEIASIMRVGYNTIKRELERGMVIQRDTNLIDRLVYCPDVAEQKYQEHLRAKGPALKIGSDRALAEYIENKIIYDGYSPQAALHKIKEDGLEFTVSLTKQTIYRYINDGVFLRITNKDLPMGGRRKQKYDKVREARLPKGDSIEDRPAEINARTTPFHWEMDSVISARNSETAKRILTMTERKTRAELIFLMPNGKAESVVAVMDGLEEKLGTDTFRRVFASITVDNGSEFQDWRGMTDTADGTGDRTHIYYCHPYRASERGSNENLNRMYRRRRPKGTRFDHMTQEQVLEDQRWMNEYPRDILGGRCAGRVFLETALRAGIKGVESLL